MGYYFRIVVEKVGHEWHYEGLVELVSSEASLSHGPCRDKKQNRGLAS